MLRFSDFQISHFPRFFQETWNFEIFVQEHNNEKDSLREMSITDFFFRIVSSDAVGYSANFVIFTQQTDKFQYS